MFAVGALLLAASQALLPSEDWLVGRPLSQSRAAFTTEPDGTLLLSNGLVSRRFVIRSGQWSTISLAAKEPFSETLRGISPEARINVSCSAPAEVRRRLLDYAPNALEGDTDPQVTFGFLAITTVQLCGYHW